MIQNVILIIFSLVGLLTGIFLIASPKSAIELQRRFYLLINWKIEPVSLSKELRNTRLMGCFIISAVLATLIFLLIKRF